MSFTPGPWVVLNVDNSDSKRIFADAHYIASVGNSDDYPEITIANARLISQAPALLEALKKLLDGVMKLPPLTAIVGVLEPQCDKARAVIAAAEDSPARR